MGWDARIGLAELRPLFDPSFNTRDFVRLQRVALRRHRTAADLFQQQALEIPICFLILQVFLLIEYSQPPDVLKFVLTNEWTISQTWLM